MGVHISRTCFPDVGLISNTAKHCENQTLLFEITFNFDYMLLFNDLK